VKDWETIADNLSKAGWSWGCVSAIDSGLLPHIAATDGISLCTPMEKLTAFVELESATRFQN
jgi:hypothetical protein